MSVQLLSPAGMLSGAPYHHVAVGAGSKSVYVAGQVAHMPDGAPVPPELGKQVAQALRNVHLGLAGAGAKFQDVVRLTFYVTQWETSHLEEFMAGVQSVAEEIGLPLPMPPASLIGVAQLFDPQVRVEIEATAVM